MNKRVKLAVFVDLLLEMSIVLAHLTLPFLYLSDNVLLGAYQFPKPLMLSSSLAWLVEVC